MKIVEMWLKLNQKTRNIIVYSLTIIFSLLFLYYGNKIAVESLTIFSDDNAMKTVQAKVTKVTYVSENGEEIGGDVESGNDADALDDIFSNQNFDGDTGFDDNGGLDDFPGFEDFPPGFDDYPGSDGNQSVDNPGMDDGSGWENDVALPSTKVITFYATITSGEDKGKSVLANQILGGITIGADAKEVAAGDNILMTEISPGEWHFSDYIRINGILVLAAIFVILLLFFGRIKGLNAILSLGLTCVAIFAVFIPSILSGKNIYASSIIVCVYSIIVTLLIANGANKKSIAAIAGCFGGVIATGILTVIMDKVLGLTGMINEEAMYLVYLNPDNPIDLKAIIFAGIIIGAVGAVMDVAMSISSALWELKEQAPDLNSSGFFKSGMNIGRDVMGTMTNTLVLAYIGSSLSLVLLLIVYVSTFTELINRELVIVELLQAVVGSLGILLTMPLTALICSVLYPQSSKPLATQIKNALNPQNQRSTIPQEKDVLYPQGQRVTTHPRKDRGNNMNDDFKNDW